MSCAIEPTIDFKQNDIGEYGFLTHVTIDKFPKNLNILNTFQANMHSISNFQSYVDNVMKSYKDNVNYEEIENYDLETLKYIYSAGGIMVSKYIWCNGEDKPTTNIPKILGLPPLIASQKIGIVPALTHATVDLLNWTFVKHGQPFDYEPTEEEQTKANCDICLGNVMVKHSMTNTKDEKWFYLVMIVIEHYGLNILNSINNVNMLLVNNPNHNVFINNTIYNEIDTMANCLKKMTALVKRMYEHCGTKKFFFENRVFLNGYSKEKFPDGLKITGTDSVIMNYDGGSAAQSSLIQCIDSFLHKKPIGCKYSIEYLEKIRNYMPAKHKNVIEQIQSFAQIHNINEYVADSNDNRLINIYDEAVNNLVKFRQAHYGLVKLYVFKFTGESSKRTGGTTPKEFLNDIIDGTKQSEIDVTTPVPSKMSLLIEFVSTLVIMCMLFVSLFIMFGMMFAMAIEHTLLCSLCVYLLVAGLMLWVWHR